MRRPTETIDSLAGRIARMLRVGAAARYVVRPEDRDRILALVDAAATAKDAASAIGGVLKLIAELERRGASTAASALRSIVLASPDAMRVVAIAWSGDRGDRRPAEERRAPHVGAPAQDGTVRAADLMRPGEELRGAHLRRRSRRRSHDSVDRRRQQSHPRPG